MRSTFMLKNSMTVSAMKRALVQGCLVGLMGGLLVGCEFLNRDLLSQNSTTNAPATDSTETSPGAETANSTPGNASTQTAGKNVACDTPSHFAEVTWQDGGPSMTYVDKPDRTNFSQVTPVAIVSNADGSTTYGYAGDSTTYVRIYPNGSCLVQTIDAQGTVTVEEFGRVGFVE
ncbi:hypothetical protein [Thermocoleostomius sinensis]|uniref:Uncharacterized protein n=1 Tax=Thermocoleostomius sinensis A174 TaxID=2016057 RepID=A0A9E9C5R9_9CYAN|nr:hypothetical protein [Thermocoleostomius sinensis]WAL61456.1 hypothetical protein OXH18_05550 [Thermocoleostomius sinensis A174]